VAKPPWSSDGNSEQLQATSDSRSLSIAKELLYAMLDLYRSDEVFQKYDKLSAQITFLNQLGISDRLINDFPCAAIMLVGLFQASERNFRPL